MRNILLVCLATATLYILPGQAQATPTSYYLIQTGTAGANTQLDVSHSSTWTFTTGASWILGGGTFDLKAGSSTTLPAVLSLYDATNFNAANLVTSVSVYPGTTPGTITTSYANASFLFGSSGVTLLSSHTYYVDLTSATGTNGSLQYFIKGNPTVAFQDASGHPIPTNYVAFGTTAPTSAPEPATITILGMALAGIGASCLGREKSRAA